MDAGNQTQHNFESSSVTEGDLIESEPSKSGSAAPPQCELPSYEEHYGSYVNFNAQERDEDSFNSDHTLIDMVHQISNISDCNRYALSIKGEICFKDPDCEFKPGELIYGYITIENIESFDIDFAACWMFFEGSYSTKDDNHNFLRMLDLQNIKCNLVTEYDDGYQLGLPVNVLKGHSKYKCCFCFELPKKLLDNQCIHDMPSHLDLLPSVIQNKSTLGFKDSNIQYTIQVRILDMAKRYEDIQSNKLKNRHSEYVVLKSIVKPINVTSSETKNLTVSMQNLLLQTIESQIQHKITVAKQMSELMHDNNCIDIEKLIDHVESQMGCSLKGSQSYQTSTVLRLCDSNKSGGLIMDECIQLSSKYKQSLGKVKSMNLKSPKTVYCVPYSQQIKEKLVIPFTLQSDQKEKLKNISVKLLVLTLKSPFPIPVEFNHDHIFKNTNMGELDDFNHNVKRKFRKQYDQLREAINHTTLPLDQFKLDKLIMDSVKTLVSIQDKIVEIPFSNIILKTDGVELNRSAWIKWNSMNEKIEAKFELVIDFASLFTPAMKRAFGDFVLIPNYQSCYGARFYYLTIQLQFEHHQFVVKLPVSIIS